METLIASDKQEPGLLIWIKFNPSMGEITDPWDEITDPWDEITDPFPLKLGNIYIYIISSHTFLGM